MAASKTAESRVGAVAWSTGEGLTRLWLDRPEALNALSERVATDFSRALEQVAREPSRVVILSGRGGAFSAGGDLAFIEANRKRPKADLAPRMRRFYGAFLGLRRLPQATIAAVNGPAVGAGLCLALACDLRVVLSTARLALNFVRLGLAPGLAAWPLARAALGETRARELLLTGRFFTGERLAEWGGASAACATPEELERRVGALAQEIAAASPMALGWLKRELALDNAELERYLALESEGQADCFKAADIVEGVAAVREKRAPRF